MWYVVRAFERQGKRPWREILVGDAPVLPPNGELTRPIQVKDGLEIKFEVSNDLNDHRLLARWSADFLARALVGRPLSWQDPRAATESVAFFTSFLSPSLNLFGTSVATGADIGAGDHGEAVRRLARAVIKSPPMAQALAKVFAAGGLSVSAANVTALASIAAVNTAINLPAWSELYRNAKAEPFLEEVLFKVSRRLVPGDEMARATARQLSESVGTVWVYNVSFYDERFGRLSTGTYRAMNEGPMTFGGVQATHFTRQVQLNPPLTGWDTYYKYPISDGGSLYTRSEDLSITLGGWDIRASGRTQWILHPPLIIDRGALSRGQQTTYSGTIEYTHGETRRHAPTTCRIKGQESVTVPAGEYSAVRFSLVAQQVQDYGMVLIDSWSVPGLGTVKMLERSPGHYWWEAELVRIERSQPQQHLAASHIRVIAVPGIDFRQSLLPGDYANPFTDPEYVATALKGFPRVQQSILKILPFTAWADRDISGTQLAVEQLKDTIRNFNRFAADRGMPIFLVGHSWGGVVSYLALSELPDSDKDRVTTLITLGSPVGGIPDAPADCKISLKLRLISRALCHYVDAKYLGKELTYSGRWINYYSSADFFSRPVKGAYNIDVGDVTSGDLAAQERMNTLQRAMAEGLSLTDEVADVFLANHSQYYAWKYAGSRFSTVNLNVRQTAVCILREIAALPSSSSAAYVSKCQR
jgi:pimeloyl-ACP methyl ester carboxylesterase